MAKFKVGDEVKGINDRYGNNPYHLTNKDMTRGKVVEVVSEATIRVEILEAAKGSRTAGGINTSHRVDPKYFELIKPKAPTKVYIKESLIEVLKGAADKYLKFVADDEGVSIERIIHNENAVIVLLSNGKKSVAKLRDGDTFDLEKGIAIAILKYHKRQIEKQLSKF